MRKVFGKRQSGKTTLLIKESKRTGYTILAPNRDQVKMIQRNAEKMYGPYAIPTPLCPQDIKAGNIVIEDTHFLVDEATYVLGALINNLGAKVDVMTITHDEFEGDETL